MKRYFFEARVRDPFGETRPELTTGLVSAGSTEAALAIASAEVEARGDSIRFVGVDAIPGCARHFHVSARTFALLVGDEFHLAPDRVRHAIARH